MAGSVIRQAGEEVELHVWTRGPALLQRQGLIWHTVDPLDEGMVRSSLSDIKPHAVIHLAAMADIDYCESHQAEAEAVNVGTTRLLASCCAERGIRLVYVSTDTVFDGERGNYAEEDPALPVNFYGQTKLKAEEVVLDILPGSVVARTSLVIGLPLLGTGNSFLSRTLSALEAGRSVGVTDQEIRSPMDVVTLGQALLELAGNDLAGRIHLSGHDQLNRFLMTQRMVQRFGYPPDRVTVQETRFDPGRARRPRDVSLNNAKACASLRTPMKSLNQALDLILRFRKG